ncbi:MAG: FumA C-terminus/TtdB family hydratase beta subunit [Spirochaetales bacterium]|nr:FumA C-terminus/TtdB family hydratase beta subunit [Spirochaetales bacterium]
MNHVIELPLDAERTRKLKMGDEVYLNGSLLVARDQAHSRLAEDLRQRINLPVEISGQTVFYMGPAPAPEGRVIGSCGPTTSARMDRYTPVLLASGLLGMIGKGPRSKEVAVAVVEHKAVYFAAFGGCGALYAECVTKVELLAYADLGPEALYRITVKDFPVITAIDAKGGNIYLR